MNIINLTINYAAIIILLITIFYHATHHHWPSWNWWCWWCKKEGIQNKEVSMLPKTAEHSDTAFLSEEQKKSIKKDVKKAWAQIKETETPPMLTEPSMKKFLEKLSAPGVDIPAPGGDTKGPWTNVIAKGPKKARSLPMEYTDKRSVARGGGAGPGNAWTPPQNPLTKTIERGHFFKLVWQCAYAFDDLKRKCKHNVESHTKWQARFSGVNDVVLAQPAVDTACCCPVPCMAGTIAAIASCASLAGSWFDPRGVTWMCMAAATYNVSKHRIMVKRFEDWVSQKKKFGCWEKKTDTRMPYPESENVLRPVPEPHIDTGKHDQKYGLRYISGSNTPRIDILVPQAMTAAFTAKIAVGVAHKATIIAIVATKLAVPAFPLEPAAFALVEAALAAWKATDAAVEKAMHITFDLAHEAAKFERSRIAACSLPGMEAHDPKMVNYVMNIKPVPVWLKLDDHYRGKGHKPKKDEHIKTMQMP